MFVWSVKMSRKKLMCIAAVGVIVVAASLTLIGKSFFPQQVTPSSTKEGISASQSSEIVAYLESFGWEVADTPCEKVSVSIPAEFNEVYEQYNIIQKKQGFDLTKYQGETVQRYAYEVLNYPGQSEYIRANVLVKDEKIIGGDICSIAANGFIHGFSMQDA